jgi:hypothetical protein
MTKKIDTTKPPLKAFRAFGIEATVWPPNAEYGEDATKIRIGRGFRDSNSLFKTSTYFSAEELVVQIEQCMKAIASVKPELVNPLLKSPDASASHDWR